MPYIHADPVAFNEGSPSLTVRVYLDAPSVNEVRVSYQVDGGTASYAGGTPDYQYQTGTLVFAPGQTERFIDIVMLDGTAVEPTEVFWLDLYSPVSATIAQRYTPIVIHDNDSNLGGAPAITVGDVTVDESSGKASFFVWLDRPSPGGVSVQYATVPGSATAGDDFVAKSGTLSFAAGSRVATVTVDLNDDALPERDESFQLQLSGAVGATLAEPVATATVGRNDTPPVSTPYIFATPAAASEGDTFIEFVVQLSAPSGNEVLVSYQTDASTASHAGATPDYQYQTGVLAFAPGETTKTVRFTQLDNTTAESSEVFWLDLYSPVNGVVLQRLTPAVIADNDQPTGTPVVSVGDIVIDETAHTATFVVMLDRPSTGTVTVGYQAVDGAAAAGQDFTLPAGTLRFAPGETLETVTVRLTDDALAEPDEQFKLVLTAPQGATLGRSEALAMIGRSDDAPVSTPYLSAKPVAAGEADTFIEFVVQLSAPSNNEVRVSYQADAGTASHAGATPDYQYQTGVLAFAPGETTKTVRFTQLDNTTAENGEVFWLDLYSPVNAIVSQRYVPAIIVDNDGSTGTPGVRVSDVVADEQAQTVSFFVTLDKSSTSLVTVDYATSGGSARQGDDYAAASGTLRFVPGQTVQKVTVSLLDDNVAELAESFHLVLGNAVGATLVDPYGKALIGRSDLAPVAATMITASPMVVSEADGLARILVQLDAPSTNEVRVSYQLDAGTASHAGATPDYLYQTGTLVFAAGETIRTIAIALLDNTVAEPTEVFNLDLYSPVNATIAQRYTPITIVDDDSGFRALSHGISDDVYEVATATDAVVESVNGGTDTIRTALNGYVLPDNVEQLQLLGTANLNGAGNALDNVLMGNAGNNRLDGGAGNDTAAWTGNAANYQVSRSGSDWIVADRVGNAGTDVAVNIERLQFADRTVAVESSPHGSYADLPEALWHFFIVAFDAAPGVTYMDQLADASRFGMSVRQIVDVFTSKSQFTEVYPATLSNAQLGVALAENIIKDSASPQAKAEAATQIRDSLDYGWTVGQMIHQVFGNLGAKPYDDPIWGGTALQFHNQIQVSKYYTEVLNQSTTDLATLRAVIDPVTQFSDVSSDAALATLVGVALFDA
ncbi:Calx-beta domain-containing protein [Quisquiliibacterium transsilvanicum]|uniref:Calx-beta domain-containing protein n=1 Tax=Quisquiliibacterium transsilvanicum TaxID=1549638 RepID=A0A7W8HLW0_9BURK|nr:Calx-beta domain-containing protein [Quisquiliibacterium transsilvanicum]MBB5273480.1 hypothetical protein [Quisquiliibacterium transsilvanicum]